MPFPSADVTLDDYDIDRLLNQSITRTHGRLSKRQLVDVVDHMVAHLDKGTSIEVLSRIAGISRFHFARLFRRTLGEPPARMLRILRVTKARNLLENGDCSIAQIALDCGFCDQAHLTRQFKALTGTTPSAFRKQFADDDNPG